MVSVLSIFKCLQIVIYDFISRIQNDHLLVPLTGPFAMKTAGVGAQSCVWTRNLKRCCDVEIKKLANAVKELQQVLEETVIEETYTSVSNYVEQTIDKAEADRPLSTPLGRPFSRLFRKPCSQLFSQPFRQPLQQRLS